MDGRRVFENRDREMLTWAESSFGHPVSITEIGPLNRKARPRCWCPLCGDKAVPERDLIPVAGPETAWHFRHQPGIDCKAAAGGEGPVHANATLLLQRVLGDAAQSGDSVSLDARCPQCLQWMSAYTAGGNAADFPPRPPHACVNVNAARTTPLVLLPGDEVVRRHQIIAGRSPDLVLRRNHEVVAVIEVFSRQPASDERWSELSAACPTTLEIRATDVYGESPESDWSLKKGPLQLSRATTASMCAACELWWRGPVRDDVDVFDLVVCLPKGRRLTGELRLCLTFRDGVVSGELRIACSDIEDDPVIGSWTGLGADPPSSLRELARPACREWMNSIRRRFGSRPCFISRVAPLDARRTFAWTARGWMAVLPFANLPLLSEMKRRFAPGPRVVVDAIIGTKYFDAADYSGLREQLAMARSSWVSGSSSRRRVREQPPTSLVPASRVSESPPPSEEARRIWNAWFGPGAVPRPKVK